MTTRVPCGEWFERRDAALMAHATQVDPKGWFFGVRWPFSARSGATEDFELVLPVDSTVPEDDLFAGSARRSAW